MPPLEATPAFSSERFSTPLPVEVIGRSCSCFGSEGVLDLRGGGVDGGGLFADFHRGRSTSDAGRDIGSLRLIESDLDISISHPSDRPMLPAASSVLLAS